jgi:deoxyribodipyrimidine photolyase-like uncharacterized protein
MRNQQRLGRNQRLRQAYRAIDAMSAAKKTDISALQVKTLKRFHDYT